MTESSYTAGDIERVEPIIGMEVHVELATRSKMFTRAPSPAFAGCSRAEEAAPNTLIDAVVLALPGALPVMNRAAVEMSMRVGLALSCQIASVSRWDRKSYFYADLPKAYQLSQYDLPLCFDGAVDVPAIDDRGVFDLSGARTRIGIIRAHLEEDAGKLLHELPGGGRLDGSIVDLNRAGTPLLEIVTQPDFTSAEQCVAFGKLLRMMCRFLGVTEGVMQRGHMRFEPNINCRVHLRGGGVVTTPIVEIKNLNSFRALGEAVAYELREQPRRWLEDGRVMGPGAKSTRGWDAERGVSVLQREKEDAHDYRYFPDPDLPPVFVDGAWLEGVRAGVGEALLSRMDRYAAEAGVGGAEATALAEERGTGRCCATRSSTGWRRAGATGPRRRGWRRTCFAGRSAPGQRAAAWRCTSWGSRRRRRWRSSGCARRGTSAPTRWRNCWGCAARTRALRFGGWRARGGCCWCGTRAGSRPGVTR